MRRAAAALLLLLGCDPPRVEPYLPGAPDQAAASLDGPLVDGPSRVDGGEVDGSIAPPDLAPPRDLAITDFAPPRDLVIADRVLPPVDGGGDLALGRCPLHMALVEDRVCVDRYEARLVEVLAPGVERPWPFNRTIGGATVKAVVEPGVKPQGYISGEQAAAACRLAGKRLCALDEWLAACRGPQKTTYPYGNVYQKGACNEGRPVHPVVQYFGQTDANIWDGVHMNDPGINLQADTVAPGGTFAQCRSAWGIYDLAGNLHEWIADPAGTFKGGFYVDAKLNGPGCLYTTTAHTVTYHDYSTGFRCCADPR